MAKARIRLNFKTLFKIRKTETTKNILVVFLLNILSSLIPVFFLTIEIRKISARMPTAKK